MDDQQKHKMLGAYWYLSTMGVPGFPKFGALSKPQDQYPEINDHKLDDDLEDSDDDNLDPDYDSDIQERDSYFY